MVLPGVRCARRRLGRARCRRFPSLSPSRGDSRVMSALPASPVRGTPDAAGGPAGRVAAAEMCPIGEGGLGADRVSAGPHGRPRCSSRACSPSARSSPPRRPRAPRPSPAPLRLRRHPRRDHGIRRRRAGARREVRPGDPPGAAGGGLRAGRAVRAHRRRHPARQRHRRAARALGHRRPGQDRPRRGATSARA